MRSTLRSAVALAVASLVSVVLVPTTAADPSAIDCTEVGAYDPGFDNWFLQPQTFDGDVVVPNRSPDEGAMCVFANPVINGDLIIEPGSPEQGELGPIALIFDGSGDGQIEGNVRVGRGADLYNYGATVGGNVTCHGCDRVELAGGVDFEGNPFSTTVRGNVVVNRAQYGTAVTEAIVKGNVSIKRSNASLDEADFVFDTVEVSRSTVHGNVHLARNTGNAGSIRVADNTIGGNLACTRNDPPPWLGAGNIVEGHIRGQCR